VNFLQKAFESYRLTDRQTTDRQHQNYSVSQAVNNQNTYFYSHHKTVTSEVAEDTDYKGHK